MAFQDMRRALVGIAAFDVVKRSLGSLVEAQVQMQQIQYTLISATGSM